MSRVRELFGVYEGCAGGLKDALALQMCPYLGRKCFKTRKSDPSSAIGTCTVSYQGNNIVICPNRLLENHQVFLDCLHLLALHEPGNELYAVPEISVPGGSVDYFLVSAKKGKVMDFAGVELQTMDTTGTVWPERQRMLSEHGISVPPADLQSGKRFGMNWKMTAKTILLQLHHKAQTLESLNKHLVLVIQQPFYEYIAREFSFSHVRGVRMGDSIHIHTYTLSESESRLKLSLENRVSTNSQGIAECLGLNVAQNVKMEEMLTTLERKIRDEYRLSFSVTIDRGVAL